VLYLFDLDGTLISSYMDNPDKDYDTWEVLPGRKAMLNRLLMRGDIVCIVTNQGGVAFGFVTDSQADRKIADARIRLGIAPVRSSGDPLPPQVYACYADERGKPPWDNPADAARRKPSGAMISEAIADHPDAAALGVFFVGDREEDRQAAQDAGVAFQWAHIFFGA
jgi:D-glycero-D-manno-heptose 1,7-bisphosphate phosphatase